MRRFSVHSPETVPEAAKSTLAAVEKAWGFIPQLHAILAESPVTLEAYDTLFGLVAETSFSPAEQQLAFLTVSVFHGCGYCTAGHTYLARAAKLEETAIAAIRSGSAIPDARLEHLRRFIETLLERRGRVGDKTVEDFLAADFSRQNVLELLVVVATKTISNYVNHIADTPMESFMSDPALAWEAPGDRHEAA